MKQTAVEWLLSKIEINLNPSLTQEELKERIEQAKEMEKQQIIDAYRDGRGDQQSERPSRFYNRNSEQYYNETFNE